LEKEKETLASQLNILVRRLKEKEETFDEHLNKARTEMDQEMQHITQSIVLMDQEHRERTEYYENKIAELIEKINRMEGAESPGKAGSDGKPSFVTGTTSLVSSHLLRSYQPPSFPETEIPGERKEKHLQPSKHHTGKISSSKEEERRPLRNDEIVINGQVGRKGVLHEWIV